jgi:hypothetical protein
VNKRALNMFQVMNQIKEFDVNVKLDEDELHGDTRIRDDDTKVNNELKRNEDKLNEVTERIDKDAYINLRMV